MGLSERRGTGGGIMKLRNDKRGSVFVALIVTMAVVSAIGAAMLPTTTTSTFSRIGASGALKANYMAESGYRYVANEYRTAEDKDGRLEELHEKTFVLSDKVEKFNLKIYPYYFKTLTDPAGSTTLETKMNGQVPPDLELTTGRLKIGPNFYNYSSATHDEKNVTFTVDTTLPSILVNTTVFSVAISDPDNDQIITQGGDVMLKPGTGEPFPLTNSMFATLVKDSSNVYSFRFYTYKKYDHETNRLIYIGDTYDEDVTLDANSDVVLQKHVIMSSTGVFGSGTAGEGGQGETGGSMEATGQTAYSIPLGTLVSDTSDPTDPATGVMEMCENFDSLDHMLVHPGEGWGTYESKMVGETRALHVTGVQGSGNNPSQEGIIGLNSGNFQEVWETLGFLSYDAQVKIKVSDEDYYANGISFRQNRVGGGNMDYLGVSYIRTRTGSGNNSDGIPDDLAEETKTPMIILWELLKHGAGSGDGDDDDDDDDDDGSDHRPILAYMVLDGSGGSGDDDDDDDDDDDGVGNEVVDGNGHLRDWATIRVRIEEKMAESGRFSGQRVNDIRAYYVGPASYPRGSVYWSEEYFSPVVWNADADSTVELREDNTVVRIAVEDYLTDFGLSWPGDDDELTRLEDNDSWVRRVFVWLGISAEDAYARRSGWGSSGDDDDDEGGSGDDDDDDDDDDGSYFRPEVGLHSYGKSAERGKVYFDDLCVRFPDYAIVVPPAFQQ